VRVKTRCHGVSWLRSGLCGSAGVAALLGGTIVSAQQTSQPPLPQKVEQPEALSSDIVVTGQRGSAVSDIDPLATLDARAIEATGASTMGELLRAIKSTTQSADGSDPIFLLNAQRVSGYQEIGTLPPEESRRWRCCLSRRR